MIPELDVRRCNAEKKYTGELVFDFEPEQSLVDIPYVSPDGSVSARLHYDILEDDSVEIAGTLSFALKGLCSRCLKETRQVVAGEAEGYFIPNGNGEEDYAYRNGVIDLREFLRDAVLFLLPARLICSETCTAPDYNEEE